MTGVSTHSRPKAAGYSLTTCTTRCWVSTHSRPKAAGNVAWLCLNVETFQHTAARRRLAALTAKQGKQPVSFNTQPPEGGWLKPLMDEAIAEMFQHTAARRRLVSFRAYCFNPLWFQHTAARRRLVERMRGDAEASRCFNTQPPEGGWNQPDRDSGQRDGFNTQPPEGGWII